MLGDFKILLLASVIWAGSVLSKPWEPEPKFEADWQELHEGFVNNSRVNGSKINIVFTGSSSIEKWSTTGEYLWNTKYAPLGAVNYGIGGDRIQHCLWRIMNGEIDNINPKMLVMYCGSNNLPSKDPDPDDEIIRGINETLHEIARRLPQTKILYLNFNPRGDGNNVTGRWGHIKYINEQILLLDHNATRSVVFDMFDDLVESWGQIRQELFESDRLHLNRDGYFLWDTLWNETFFGLWEGRY